VATTAKERQYWDSNLFIDFLTDKSSPQSQRSKTFKDLVAEARSGHSIILLSNIVLAEVRPKRARNGEHRELLEELLEANRPFVQFYGVTRRIALRARDEGAKHSLSIPDAIHVATALEAKAKVLFTYDGLKKDAPISGLLRLNGQMGNPPLRIEVPRVRLGPLFNHGR
jgi:predicted nucleic acid-binding protein